jgi:hypothetical protein
MFKGSTICIVLVICMAGPFTAMARAGDDLSLDPLSGDLGQSPNSLALGGSKLPPRGIAAPKDSLAVALLSEEPTNQWRVSLELPIWAAGIDGTVGVRGFATPVHASFLDILESSDSVIGLELRPSIGYGPWTFFVDGLYMKMVVDDVSPGPSTVKFTNEMVLVDSGLYYRLGTWQLGGNGSSPPALTVDVGPGARYMHVRMQLNTLRGASRSRNLDWADPIVTTQIALDLDKHWRILTRADVGGAVSSDLTWSAAAYVSYRFQFSSTVLGSLNLGYKAVSEDYHQGSGNQRVTWDAILHGPVIAFTVEF